MLITKTEKCFLTPLNKTLRTKYEPIDVTKSKNADAFNKKPKLKQQLTLKDSLRR